MSFFDIIDRTKTYLRRHGRVSLRALGREFALGDRDLDAVVDELVRVQQVAVLEGAILAWAGDADPPSAVAERDRAANATRSSPLSEAERRQLTVMFSDLVGSTELAASMDPEDWRELVRSYQEAAAAVVERFGGHVAQYLGDGLVVYFGWPRAYEDAAERAVRAGLGIVGAVEGLRSECTELSVRIGMHTGAVVVGEMGGGATREMLAMGDTTNVAARLQGIAEPDTVVLSAATLRLVPGIFVTRDVGEQTLKGLAEPIRAFAVLQASGVRSRLDVIAATEFTPFLGREQDLMLLEDRFAQAVEGSGQAILICGEAGIGKSRLVKAFRGRLVERAHSWLECRGSPYTQDSALLPVIELQQRALGFRADDSGQAKLAAIEAGLADVQFDLPSTVPLVAELPGVVFEDRYASLGLSAEAARKRTLSLLTEWLLRLGQRQPLVLLMEDLHWMDPSTVELLGRIVEQVPTAPLLLLTTHRPDFKPPWDARSHVTPMLLSRFPRPLLAELVRKVAGGRRLPDGWLEEILRRADGVPLFAEELTRTVLDAHPQLPKDASSLDLHIPHTLQDSLMARLDALGPVKHLAQLASVLGREFEYGLLLAVSHMGEAELQAALAAAVRKELFYQRGTPPEAVYLFKHALIRDAAYESMLRSIRRRHHRRVAETLVDQMPQVVAERPELVARHWAGAGEAEMAIDWWQRAGRHALDRASPHEAASALRRAVDLLAAGVASPAVERQELEIRLLLGLALIATRGYAAEEVEENYSRARSLAERLPESREQFAVWYGLVSYHFMRGRIEQSLEMMQHTLNLCDAIGFQGGAAATHFGIGDALWVMGKLDDGRLHLEKAIAMYDRESDRPGQVFVQDTATVSAAILSLSLWMQGHPDQAVVRGQWAIAWAREVGHPFSLAQALAQHAYLHWLRRDFEVARRWAEETKTLSHEHDFPLWDGFASLVLGCCDAIAARDPGGLAAISSARQLFSRSGVHLFSYLVGQTSAEASLACGRVVEGLEDVVSVLDEVPVGCARVWESDLWRLRGELTRALDAEPTAEAEAERCFQHALGLARRDQARSFELRAATALARLHIDQGSRPEAGAILRPVYDRFAEGYETRDLKDAKALLDMLT